MLDVQAQRCTSERAVMLVHEIQMQIVDGTDRIVPDDSPTF